MNSNFNKLYRKLSGVCNTVKNARLDELTSFRIGGVASIVTYPSSIEQIIKVMDIIDKHQARYMVAGNCTNILVGDYEGVIVKIAHQFGGIELNGNVIIADSGAPISRVAMIARDHGLTGMEGLYGIPGTVGGATVMNAGAFGADMSQVVTSVLAITNGKITHYTNAECAFAYRSSAFADSIILRVEFTLREGDREQIAKAMDDNMMVRRTSQPLSYPSAGCTFANPKGMSVGKVLEQDGWKGYRVGDAMISPKHANFIVNMGNATKDDVLTIIRQVQQHFSDKYNVQLRTEIKIID